MRAIAVSTLLLAGCAGDLSLPAGADHADPGYFGGDLFLELRAFVGPIPVKRESCEVRVILAVDPTAADLVDGGATCSLPTFGDFDVVILGDATALPVVTGTLVAAPVEAPWEGFFSDPDSLSGDAAGRSSVQGFTVHYEVSFDAAWAAPLGGTVG